MADQKCAPNIGLKNQTGIDFLEVQGLGGEITLI
jgi:hypothetical protein